MRETLEAAFAWCEQYSVVSEAPDAAERGNGIWGYVEDSVERMGVAILSRQERTDAELMGLLQRSGRVRRFAVDGAAPGHFIRFQRGDEIRFALASAPLRASTVDGPALWFFWEGPKEQLPEGLHAIFDDCLSSSTSAADHEVNDGLHPSEVVAAYSRRIPSVREVLGVRNARNFLELEPDAQEHALWSALIGEGPVDLEQAVRLCAERLRAQGFLEYQALRQDGRVYAAIEERLLAARRRTDLFDRPRNGFVRAIEPDLDRLNAEQWRDCLMGAIEPSARVDRDQAVRLGFVHAQEIYGVSAQRLRAGGRADQALRSAINSAIRQGLLARDGAAYLVRVAPPAPPTLRGVIAEGSAPDSARVRGGADPLGAEDGADHHVVQEPARADETSTAVLAAESTRPRGGDAPGGAESENGVPPAPGSEPPSLLDRSLDELDFPTRTLNWAHRKGIETVRGLVEWHPDSFVTERNVGRRTVRETRELLEARLGCTWEEAHDALRGGRVPGAAASGAASNDQVDGTTEALTAGGAAGWSGLAASLSDEQRAIPLVDVKLPTRMRNFVRTEGLQVLGELFALSHASLAERENLGRKSINDTLDAVRDFLSERAAPATYATFLQDWQAQLSELEPVARMIVTRRAGMHGTRETLEELGGMLGVTRERVRQIEARVLQRLSERSRWRRTVDAKLAAAFGAARALPLALLAEDPWWAGIEQQELLLDYVVRRIFEDELFLLSAPSGKRYLTKFPCSELEEHLENAKVRLAKLEYPVETSAIEAILHSEADPLDPILFAEFDAVTSEMLHFDGARPGFAVGFGRHRDDEVIAFLNAQAEPVPVALLEERCGRGHLPDAVLHFKRGVVGLKRHFPDFDGWMARLVPPALEVMQERPAGRQWLVPELHDALRERGLVPEWLGHWHLASVLRLSGQVDYLGRLRVATKDSAHEERLQYEELLEALLEDAGGPLDFGELLARARVQTDIGEGAAGTTTLSAPFVRLDERRVGLVERDIPGGPQAVAAALEVVLKALTDTQRGLTPFQATELVRRISPEHATWTRQLVTSVLRNETSVRIDRSKNIGLDEWDDVRCPTRPEFVRREVQSAGGVMAVAELCAEMERVYGRAPDRAQLGVLASQVGLTLSGEQICRREVLELDAPATRPTIDLSGIPAELREMFEELVQQPLSDLPELRQQISEHVAAIEVEHHVNEFVDVAGAQVLARQAERLLERWETLAPGDRHLAHAAIRYFVSWNDFENDLNIGGLDDDKQIMNAVLSYLALEEHDDDALAS